eukprot:TRINITY_DN277_c0_g1_i4.p2 TRINITY_DN277_c0_g1~~TRINITY_DN277_c0_g1_i4.p2  ORF type:complete len:105 (-),score=2.10 TRINITY_DN277_c0_g1_i4:139-453(-)
MTLPYLIEFIFSPYQLLLMVTIHINHFYPILKNRNFTKNKNFLEIGQITVKNYLQLILMNRSFFSNSLGVLSNISSRKASIKTSLEKVWCVTKLTSRIGLGSLK